MKKDVIVINTARNEEYIIIPDKPISFDGKKKKIFNKEYNIEIDEKEPEKMYNEIVNILIDKYKENELDNCKVFKRVL